MKKTLYLLMILILISMALAEITVHSSTKSHENSVYKIFAEDGKVFFTPNVDVLETYVFIDGEQAMHFGSLDANETKLRELTKGLHSVEIRSLVKQNYFWDEYKITKNDYPFYLSYASYDKDDRKINFAIKGADAIHPDDLTRTGKSLKKSFDNYSVVLNDQLGLVCYPLITTGKQIPFNCYSSQYAYTLNISLTIGFMENTTVNITKNKEKVVFEPSVVEETNNDVPENNPSLEDEVPKEEATTEQIDSISGEADDEIISEDQGNDWIIPLVVILIVIVVLIGYFAKKNQKAKEPPRTNEASVKPKEKIKVNKIEKIKRMP